jgi:hypothetical protein
VEAVIGLDRRHLLEPRAGNDLPVPGMPFVFQPGRSALARSGTAKGCEAGRKSPGGFVLPGFTPNQWLRAYGIADLHRRGLRGEGHRLAVVEIDGLARADLEAAARCFGYEIPRVRVHLAGIDAPLPPGPETTLNLQVIAPIAPRLASLDVFQGVGTDVGSSCCSPSRSRYRRRSDRPSSLPRSASARAPTRGRCPCCGSSSGSCSLPPPPGSRSSPPRATPARATAPRTTPAARSASCRSTTQRGSGIGGPNRLVPDLAFLADPVPGYTIHGSRPARRGEGFTSVGGTSRRRPLARSQHRA